MYAVSFKIGYFEPTTRQHFAERARDYVVVVAQSEMSLLSPQPPGTLAYTFFEFKRNRGPADERAYSVYLLSCKEDIFPLRVPGFSAGPELHDWAVEAGLRSVAPVDMACLPRAMHGVDGIHTFEDLMAALERWREGEVGREEVALIRNEAKDFEIKDLRRRIAALEGPVCTAPAIAGVISFHGASSRQDN